MAAVADDDEAARAYADAPDAKPEPPALTDWTPVVDMLAKVYDRLGVLIAATAGQKKPPPPHERPQTATHRARQRRRRAMQHTVLSRIEATRQRQGGAHG